MDLACHMFRDRPPTALEFEEPVPIQTLEQMGNSDLTKLFFKTWIESNEVKRCLSRICEQRAPMLSAIISYL